MTAKTIDAAILAHRSWVSRFKTASMGINTEYFDMPATLDWSACDLGRWLAGDDSAQILDAETQREIHLLHVRFHQVSGVLAMQLNQRRIDGSLNDVIGELDALSKQIVRLLFAAKEKASLRTPLP